MKTVKLSLNIGTIDNAKLKLPETVDGSVIEVTDEVAKILTDRNWASLEESPAPAKTGKPVKAVPDHIPDASSTKK